jgi:hypothetical protein
MVSPGQFDEPVVVTAFVRMKFLNPPPVESNQIVTTHFFQRSRGLFEQGSGFLQVGFPEF